MAWMCSCQSLVTVWVWVTEVNTEREREEEQSYTFIWSHYFWLPHFFSFFSFHRNEVILTEVSISCIIISVHSLRVCRPIAASRAETVWMPYLCSNTRATYSPRAESVMRLAWWKEKAVVFICCLLCTLHFSYRRKEKMEKGRKHNNII